MSSPVLKTCTNLGCNREYSEEDNDGLTDPCLHHPGHFFFHDAYKGWNCCQQKSTDFSTFLNFKPCKVGKHSDVKRAIEKPKPIVETLPIVEKEIKEEREWDEEWISLEITEAKNLEEDSHSGQKATSGQKKCDKCGKSEESALKEGPCVYHVGQCVFHETLKYWTCCPKKFTDFEEFKGLKGCKQEKEHVFSEVKPRVREDFFQTNTDVTIVLYGLKARNTSGTHVRTNGKRVLSVFCDQKGEKVFEKEWNLWAKVDKRGTGSRVRLEKNKTEIVLKKWDFKQFWNQLENK